MSEPVIVVEAFDVERFLDLLDTRAARQAILNSCAARQAIQASAASPSAEAPIERAEQDVLDALERWSPFHLAVAYFELQRRGWNREKAELERRKARQRGAP